MGLSPNLRPNLASHPQFGLIPDLRPNFGLSLKDKTGLSSTFELRPDLHILKMGITYVKCVSFGLKP